MERKLPLKEQLKGFNEGKYESTDILVQIQAGWYDWFCRDVELLSKTRKLYSTVKQISNSPKINLDSQYVWFKNNCPVNGKLYDDFRIADIKTRDTIYVVIPSLVHKYELSQSEVWGKENDFCKPIFQGSWEEVKQWFLS